MGYFETVPSLIRPTKVILAPIQATVSTYFVWFLYGGQYKYPEQTNFITMEQGQNKNLRKEQRYTRMSMGRHLYVNRGSWLEIRIEL